MGTDIHMAAEVRRGGYWVNTGPVFTDEYNPNTRSAEPYSGRCYDLFAALADVRNGAGFAGVDTGDAIEPIAEPRGLPEDVTDESLALLSDEHTPSWLTLAELDAYDWDQTKIKRGVVPADVYEHMKANGWTAGTGTPTPYDAMEAVTAQRRARGERVDAFALGVSGGISGPGIVTFTPQGYDEWLAMDRMPVGTDPDKAMRMHNHRGLGGALVEQPLYPGKMQAYVKVQWTTSLRESISDHWFTHTLPELRQLTQGDGEDVRVVFDFDS